jgi:hypothetical protein
MVVSGHDEGDPEVAGGGDGGRSHEAAQHHQIAVREVDDVHDAEDQREPGGHQRQDHAVDQPVDRLHQDLLDGDAHAHTPRY